MSDAVKSLSLDEKRKQVQDLLSVETNGHTPKQEKEEQRPELKYYEQTLDMFMQPDVQAFGEIDRFNQWVHDASEVTGYPLEAYRTDTQDTVSQIQRLDGPALEVLSFVSYSFYLGYSLDPQVLGAAKDALDQFGFGSGGSPLIGGRLGPHMDLERSAVDFFGLPDRGISIFPSGFGANSGTISAFANKGDTIVFDELAHTSMQEGAYLSGADIRYFRHNSADHLESVLKELRAQPNGKEMRILVGMEGCYSADGDFGKLDKLVPVAKRYGAKVLVDEAHSMLMIGPGGKGMAAEKGVLEEVDLLMMTFSKGFGGIGGGCYASKETIQYLNFFAKTRMFSCALGPAMSVGVAQVFKMAGNADGDARRARVQGNGKFLRDRLRGKVDIGESESWIVPVLLGGDDIMLPVLDYIQRNGLDTGVMQYPAAPPGKSRLRFFITSEHTEEQLTRAAEITLEAAKEFGFHL